MALTNLEGEVTDRYHYGPFGEFLEQEGDSENRFLYNGRDGVQTDAHGLYHMRARYYNPEIKRFINQDIILGEITNSQSLNRFAYVSGNPVFFVDPDGQILATATGAVIGGAVGGVSAWLQGKDVWTGIASGAVSGAIVGAAVDITVATGGTGLIAVGGIAFAGAVGGFSGDVIDQVGNQMRSQGSSFEDAVSNIDYRRAGISAGVGGAAGALSGGTYLGIKAVTDTSRELMRHAFLSGASPGAIDRISASVINSFTRAYWLEMGLNFNYNLMMQLWLYEINQSGSISYK